MHDKIKTSLIWLGTGIVLFTVLYIASEFGAAKVGG